MSIRWYRAASILGAGAALGLLWNGFSSRGFALDKSVFVQAGDEVIEAPEAKARLDHGALFLDARPLDFYKMSHIAGALPLPEPEFDAYFARLELRLRSSFNNVIYCAGYGCEASHVVARKLREKNIHAAILNEGWPAWTDAGYATKQGGGAVNLFRHPRLLLGFRLVLAAMFLYASHDKILAPGAFAKIVYQWQVGGYVFSNLVAVILPWVELIIGLLLLAGVWTREAGLVAAGLLLVFNLAAVSVLARGIDVTNCGCTSVSAGAEKSPFRGVGAFLLTRNGFLLLAALGVVLAPGREAEGEVALPTAAPAPAP